MTTIMVGVQSSVVVLDSSDDLKIREISKGSDPPSRKSDPPRAKPPCLVSDPQNPDRPYSGYFDNGLWKTDDRGQSWLILEKMPFPAHKSRLLLLIL